MMVAEFGFSRWGADVVRIAEPLSARVVDPLAPRARSLARNDGVVMTVAGGAVQGHVSRGGQASLARLEFAAMAPEVAAAVRALLGTATEPDDDVHRQVTAAGHRPGPQLVAADCSCRARSDRCVHILATLYALASAIDHRPGSALELQGFHRSTQSADSDPTEGRDERAAPPVRWIPLSGLDVRSYWDPVVPTPIERTE